MFRILIIIFLFGLIFQNKATAQQKSVVYIIGDSLLANSALYQ